MAIATLILAAGNSTRLSGTPKQLLTHNGETLVRRMANAALALSAGPVLVIVGANQEQIRTELADLPVRLVDNSDWREGMSTSLRAGLSALATDSIDAFLIILTDQPYVTVDLLRELIATRQQTGKGITVCRYGEPGNLGVPALFNISYKSEFLLLTGDTGARKLIQQHTEDCAEVDFPLAAIDLDTWQDVEKWQREEG